MNNNNECKIVEDLLPMYVDNLTNDVTNKFIEDHLAKCPECKQKLLDIQHEVDIELNDIDLDAEIDGLKKIKKRTRLIITSCIIGVIALCSLFLWFNNNYRFYINEDGKISLYEINPEKKYSDCSYIIIKGKKYAPDTTNGYIDITTIIAVNSLDRCICLRQIVNGYTDDRLNELYNEYSNKVIHLCSNVKLENNTLYYNCTNFIDKDKDFIISKMTNYYDEIEYIKNL